MKKIVYVTGCLGFIGSQFTRDALQMGWKVYGVDKGTYAANNDILKEFQKYDSFSFERKDIRKLDYLHDCDYVVNFAAESHVENSITDSEQFINSNVLGVKNILDLIRYKHKNVGDRPVLIHISTDEVYGDIAAGEHLETDILCPSNPYSASKAAADMLVTAWSRTYDLDYVIVRPTNNYGKNQFPEKLIPLTVHNLLRGRQTRLHNGGEPIRNWLHVEDTSEAIFTILDSLGEPDRHKIVNNVFNVAGGFEQRNIDTVRKIVKEFFAGREQPLWHKLVDFEYNRIGQDVRYALNDDKLRELGWKPIKNFDEEIPKLVEHYRERFSW